MNKTTNGQEPVTLKLTNKSAGSPADEQNNERRASAPTASESVEIKVDLGRRVMILGDLLLPTQATQSSNSLVDELSEILERWQGPGIVIICGNLFSYGDSPLLSNPDGLTSDKTTKPSPAKTLLDQANASIAAHPKLSGAFKAFTSQTDCHILIVPAWRDEALRNDTEFVKVLKRLGVELAAGADLHLETGAGKRVVLVRSAVPNTELKNVIDLSLRAPNTAGRPWLKGIDRLEDPLASRRFVTSRMLYRRLHRYVWMPPLVIGTLALLLRLPIIFKNLRNVVRGRGPRGVLTHVYTADWAARILVILGLALVITAIVALVVALASRGIWRALGGGDLPRPWSNRPIGSNRSNRSNLASASKNATSNLLLNNTDLLDEARRVIASGGTGLIAGGGLRPELTHLDVGFFASPGGTTEIVREHPGKAGLPPVFIEHRQSNWLELETGADLHVRLLHADSQLTSSTFIERLACEHRILKGHKSSPVLHPSMVAAWPVGASWPPAPEVAADRIRVRRVRRIAASAIFIAGLTDLLSALTPPLRSHLHIVEQLLPLGAAQAAGAFVALGGIGLMMLARGILRGQRRAWSVSVTLLALTLVLHLVHGGFLWGLVLTSLVLVFLVIHRRRFGAATDSASLWSALLTLVGGGIAATIAATVAVEVSTHVHHRFGPDSITVLLGSAERLVGLQLVTFPTYINGFVSPSLLVVGISLSVATLYLLTRPVVDRRLSTGNALAARRASELRARDIVRRHGSGTLDYFALRDDKKWFFHRDSMVAYAVYGGVCLVSPDPIGPRSEHGHIWDAFRQFVDRNGWGLGVMGAGEDWLPTYRDSGMRHIYIGDEAVVNVETFSLNGGKMKGLRQAVNRVERYGYTVEFLDPARLRPEEALELIELMEKNRRGEQERGFSMMLGRLFDPRDTGLLLTLVKGPDSKPVAMCQFVPSPSIRGFSLDLMRRDSGEHPNGLLDFALCATIAHLKERGERGLSLNFAAMRSVLEGESGDGVTQRVERWVLKRLSGVLQIESLWKFNAKYEPVWLPRYVVYDSAEQFLPVAVQLMRAESLTDIPIVGRLLTANQSKK